MVLLSFACNGFVARIGKVACGSFSGGLIKIQIFQLIGMHSSMPMNFSCQSSLVST